LYGVPSSNQDEEDGTHSLALPQALVPRQSWVSQDTNLRIRETCGEAGSRICRRKFSSARRLRVHAPQHFINVFCPCDEYLYQRDYVLRHQRISRCYTGHVFAVDQATFPEFQDLILPHVGDPHKSATLSQGFLPCRTIQEEDEEPTAASQPAATQPFRVVLAPGPIPRPWAPDPQRQTDGAQSAAVPAPDLSWKTRCATYDCAWHGVRRISPNYAGGLINWNGTVPVARMGPTGSNHHPRISAVSCPSPCLFSKYF